MSSWKSADKKQQRAHKERSQPSFRKQFGLLQKKKDYKARARDYHRKQNTLLALKRKALNKNPDEFYFHMINSHTEDGEHFEKQKIEENTEEELKLMQCQDLNYINMRRMTESKKVERMKAGMHFLDVEDKPKNQHVFFVDSKEEVKKFNLAKKLNTNKALLGRSYNRLSNDQLKDVSMPYCNASSMEEMAKMKKKQYKELSKRIEREKKLDILAQKMQVKKQLLNKKDAPMKKVKDGAEDTPPVYEWKQERKR